MIFAVADGVGGYEGGKIASSLAVDILKQNARTISNEEEFRSCVENVHLAMLSVARELGFPLMGTTVAAARLIGGQVLIANVGDSPIFLIRDRKVIALYYDDSQRYEDSRNLWALTQYAGFGARKLTVHTRTLASEKGDVLLLCSDGVSDNLLEPSRNFDRLVDLVMTSRSAKVLVEEAMGINYKRDDMSAILIFF